MSASAKDLLAFARSLVTDDQNESATRAAISRAYYAAFHALLPYMSQFPREDSERKSYVGHEDLETRIARWKVPDQLSALRKLAPLARSRARYYQAARLARVKADYQLDATIDIRAAELQLLRVDDLIRFASKIDEALSEAAGAELQEG